MRPIGTRRSPLWWRRNFGSAGGVRRALRKDCMTLKPIETRYNGYRFRSRLEARWAVFMDRIGVSYEYETEGYDLGGGVCYLPDFFIRHQDCFFEVKPFEPDAVEWGKAVLLAKHSQKRVFFLVGTPTPTTGSGPHILIYPEGTSDGGYSFCQCTECEVIGLESNGRSRRLSWARWPRVPCGCEWPDDGEGPRDGGENASLFNDAYEFARAHRFERGGSKKVTPPTSFSPDLVRAILAMPPLKSREESEAEDRERWRVEESRVKGRLNKQIEAQIASADLSDPIQAKFAAMRRLLLQQ